MTFVKGLQDELNDADFESHEAPRSEKLDYLCVHTYNSVTLEQEDFFRLCRCDIDP